MIAGQLGEFTIKSLQNRLSILIQIIVIIRQTTVYTEKSKRSFLNPTKWSILTSPTETSRESHWSIEFLLQCCAFGTAITEGDVIF